jgi:AraC family transcriptional regulator
MHAEHISLALDRHERPINFSRLLWSSEGTAWSGFRLERHEVGPVGRLQDFAVPDNLLGLCVGGSAELTIGAGPHAERRVAQPARFVLLAAGDEQAPIEWLGMRETLYLSMDGDQVDRLLGPEARGPGSQGAIHLKPQYATEDRQVTRLMLNMVEEVIAGCPAGRLYGEALSVALADYLMITYGRDDRAVARPGGRLSRAMAARVVDYMRAHLDRNVSLGELGELVGLSPHHFSLVFKNTFDTTPHRYLLQQRVEKAKLLLASGRQSIGEAALEVGFSNQSHFTRMFRRLSGETPRAYRQARS